jgi:pimeloyl-ACP methyl ester carboxylesterase
LQHIWSTAKPHGSTNARPSSTQISVPVLVRYGATDVLVPPAHGEYLAPNVPGCVVKVDDTAGHLATNPEQEIAENIHWLRDGVPPPGSRPA